MEAKVSNTLVIGAAEQLAAAAVAQAEEVFDLGNGDLNHCLCCLRRVPLARVVINKPASVGRTEAAGFQLAGGVCADCIAAASEDRQAALVELVQVATRTEALLSLIRHRAELQLGSWWGSVGACLPGDVDQVSVALRRAVERLGVKA